MPRAGSRRRRLWELEGHAHCPVVGVCLPIATLRRQLARPLAEHAAADDYQLHCVVVSASKVRGVIAEAVHDLLERRFSVAVRAALKLRSTDDLAAWWRQNASGEALAGAMWATLTHPRCDTWLSEQVLGTVHMLQHQVGSETRVDAQRLRSLDERATALSQQLAEAGERARKLAAEAARRQEAMVAELAVARTDLAECRTRLAQQTALRQALESADPGLEDRLALARRVDALDEENRALQRALVRARPEAVRPCANGSRGEPARTAATGPVPVAQEPAQTDLGSRAVLCVGGRTASVPIYREVVERTGGRFLHHDGGDEDAAARLNDTLSAADLVVCQTGCISHGAYWRVKEHCKRTGKPCLFVETPSRSALQRALLRAATGPLTDSTVHAASHAGNSHALGGSRALLD